MYNINEKDELKKISIIDWGSIVFSKIVLNNYNQCTPDFMAPELNTENREIDIYNIPSIKSDIFSLAIVILYIIDPSKEFLLHIDNYIKISITIDNQNNIIDDIIDNLDTYYYNFRTRYSHYILSQHIIMLVLTSQNLIKSRAIVTAGILSLSLY